MINSNPVTGLPGGLLRFIELLDRTNRAAGRAVAWLSLLMVLMTFFVVLLRYMFDLGSIAMQESVTYMHAALFMIGAAYTLQRDAHVRVDIFYQRMSRRGRAWVNLLGTLLLLMPVCLFILLSSWGYVFESWQVMEGSPEAGGIPAVWVLKALILLLPLLLLLQGLAWLLRNGLFLAGVAAALPNAESETGRA